MTGVQEPGYRRDASGSIHIEPKQAWYSVKLAGAILGIGRMSVQRYIDARRLKAEGIGGTHRVARWRISHAALVSFIEDFERR